MQGPVSCRVGDCLGRPQGAVGFLSFAHVVNVYWLCKCFMYVSYVCLPGVIYRSLLQDLLHERSNWSACYVDGVPCVGSNPTGVNMLLSCWGCFGWFWGLPSVGSKPCLFTSLGESSFPADILLEWPKGSTLPCCGGLFWVLFRVVLG